MGEFMLSVVVPIYNEREVLPDLIDRISMASREWDIPFEILAVSDGSTDGSTELLIEKHIRDPRWKVLVLSRNFGHQQAISAGLDYAVGDAVVVMDGDLQDPPEEIARLLDTWRQGYQVVYATRRSRQEPRHLRIAYSLYYRLLRSVASIEIPPDSGDFCLMDRSIVEILRRMPEKSRFLRGLRCWAGFRQASIQYDRPLRAAGRSKYTFPRLLRLAADGVFSFSYLPLRMATLAGGIATTLSSLGILLTFGMLLARGVESFPGANTGVLITSFSLGLLLLGGIQLVGLGLMGEYVARILDEVRDRPGWVIQSSHGIVAEADLFAWRQTQLAGAKSIHPELASSARAG